MIHRLVPVKPLTVKILSKLTIMETEKDYSITCEVTGSHPRARVTWIEGNETFRNGKVDIKRYFRIYDLQPFFFYFKLSPNYPIMCRQMMENDNASVVLSTLIFSPVPDDHGKILKCRGENPALTDAYLEDFFKLNVVCKELFSKLELPALQLIAFNIAQTFLND